MGCYVNPPGLSKESWLKTNGVLMGSILIKKDTPIIRVCGGEVTWQGLSKLVEESNGVTTKIPNWDEFASDSLPVVLVDNGPFTAGAVGFCKREYEYFCEHHRDIRPRLIYQVPVDRLFMASDLDSFKGMMETPMGKTVMMGKTVISGKRKIDLEE